jgi:hypothetical protein
VLAGRSASAAPPCQAIASIILQIDRHDRLGGRVAVGERKPQLEPLGAQRYLVIDVDVPAPAPLDEPGPLVAQELACLLVAQSGEPIV